MGDLPDPRDYALANEFPHSNVREMGRGRALAALRLLIPRRREFGAAREPIASGRVEGRKGSPAPGALYNPFLSEAAVLVLAPPIFAGGALGPQPGGWNSHHPRNCAAPFRCLLRGKGSAL